MDLVRLWPRVPPDHYLVSTNVISPPLTLKVDSSSNALGCNDPRLSNDDVTVAVHSGVVVQDVLRYLGGLATAGLTLNDGHLIALNRVNDLQR